ncbi:HAMP domain-containing protein [candidate division KSB1 bacterium]|nr:HAMP domain-containing protein [candidate division KSB1 bacterium]
MKFIPRKSIKRKVVFITTLMSAFPLILMCILFILYFRSTYRNATVQSVESLTKVLAENGSAALMFEYSEDANELLSSLKTNDQIADAYFITLDNRILAEHHKHGAQLRKSFMIPKSDSLYFKNNYLHLFQKVEQNSERVGTVYLRADLQQMNKRISRYALLITVVFIVISLLIFLLSLRIQKIITSPILHLAAVARNFSVHKDHSIRARLKSKDELGFLAERFNEMLDHIRNNENALRRELSERELTEKKLISSLKEKEVLLKEIHHRVKNNLQVISSLLSLQTEFVKDEGARQMFRESQTRVRSMALIHETLYRSGDLARIDISEYTRSLVRNLFRSFKLSQESITLTIEVENVYMDINTAIPCGLIINELVSNSLKHAFPIRERDRTGQSIRSENEIIISITKRDDNLFELIVADNGISLPKEIDHTNTLGLQLVHTLTEQINGSIILDVTGGTKFTIVFGI